MQLHQQCGVASQKRQRSTAEAPFLLWFFLNSPFLAHKQKSRVFKMRCISFYKMTYWPFTASWKSFQFSMFKFQWNGEWMGVNRSKNWFFGNSVHYYSSYKKCTLEKCTALHLDAHPKLHGRPRKGKKMYRYVEERMIFVTLSASVLEIFMDSFPLQNPKIYEDFAGCRVKKNPAKVLQSGVNLWVRELEQISCNCVNLA